MDHSLRAAPHGLSQLATSFLACPRLGIPRVPLPRLTSSLVSHRPMQSSKKSDRPHPAKHLKRSTFPFTRIVKELERSLGDRGPCRLVRPAPEARAAKLRIEAGFGRCDLRVVSAP
jgi:hypothetical protein